MTWLQHTQSSLSEKVSRAEDFHSHMLLRQSFRNWLKVCLHPNGEMIAGEPASAMLSLHHHSTHVQLKLCWLALSLFQHHPIPFLRGLPSSSTTQDTLLHTVPHFHILPFPLLPADFPPLLSLLSPTISALLYVFIGLGVGERSHSHLVVFLPQYKDYMASLEERANTLRAVCLKRKFFWAWFDLVMEEKDTLREKLMTATEHSDK